MLLSPHCNHDISHFSRHQSIRYAFQASSRLSAITLRLSWPFSSRHIRIYRRQRETILCSSLRCMRNTAKQSAPSALRPRTGRVIRYLDHTSGHQRLDFLVDGTMSRSASSISDGIQLISSCVLTQYVVAIHLRGPFRPSSQFSRLQAGHQLWRVRWTTEALAFEPRELA